MNGKTLDSGISSHGSMKSIKIGENSCIRNAHPIKTAIVYDSVWYGKPKEGHKYVVHHKHETTGESTYSICICKDDMWVPDIVDVMNFIGFNGIPINDDDEWIDLDVAFNSVKNNKNDVDEEYDKKELGNREPDVTDMTCREYLQYCVEQREADELKQISSGIKNSKYKAIQVESDPNKVEFKNIYQRIDDIINYIDEHFIDNSTVEQNWKILKDAVNTTLDKIDELEDRIKELKDQVNELENHTVKVAPDIPLQPYTPYTPYIPYTPSPVTPGYPTPWQPTITCSTPCNDIKTMYTCTTNNTIK